MDSVAEAMTAAAALGEARPDQEPIDVAAGVPLTSALLIFIGSGAALGLAMYFLVCLSDLSDDLLNPYTLCDRVNSKLHIELTCHGAVVFAFLIALHFWGLLLSAPTLALRMLWWMRSKLRVDATTCYQERTQSELRTRWCIMCAWHGIALMFGFVQLLLHFVVFMHRQVDKSGLRQDEQLAKAAKFAPMMHPFAMGLHGM